MTTQRRAGAGFIATALFLTACGGATEVTPLPNTPLSRGAHGPFVATLVTYPLAQTPQSEIEAEFHAAAKARHGAGWLAEYLVRDGVRVGVITLWSGAEAEHAFHTEAWSGAMTSEHHAAPSLESFDVPVWIGRDLVADDGARDRTVAIVSLPLPWLHPRSIVESKIVARVPEYQAMPALLRKYFTVTDDAHFGGIYLWRSRSDAASYYDATWRARAREKWGADAVMRYFSVLDVAFPAATAGG